MSSKLAKAILKIAPNAEFVIRGTEIEWHSKNITQPTQEAIDAAIDVVDSENYKDLRAAEYPPIEDYLDGIVKGDQKQIDSYIDACLAVKAKYPKPKK